MSQTSNYTFGATVDKPFAAVVEAVTEALASEGFGVLSDIDVAAALHKKLGVTMPPYRILGACNPHLASKAIAAEPTIGALLPCNVVVREDEAGKVHVDFMDPQAVLGLVQAEALVSLGEEVKAKLERVLAALSAG